MAIEFYLNDKLVKLDNFAPHLTLLDYLRLNRNLLGSKEGCAEGDCGACTVLIGLLNSDDELVYETVNGCIRFMGSLHGWHIVTVEHLRAKNGKLHPVQQAMVDCNGSQCGFCTPGFIMSLYGLWLSNPKPSRIELERALQGNLCRCTGYVSILRTMDMISQNFDPQKDPLYLERKEIKTALNSIKQHDDIIITHDSGTTYIPLNTETFAKILDTNRDATIVSGSTDVGLTVTKHMKDISPVVFINHLAELQEIEDNSDALIIGAGATYSDAQAKLLSNFPQMNELFFRIGGQQVRNMGTIGGNIANGSPIGDMAPPLIALGATLELMHTNATRTLPLEQFFIQHGKQDRAKNEFIKSIKIPKLGTNEYLTCYKISKRTDEDISALTMAIWMHLEDDKITDIRITMGGMAGTPKRATHVEQALIGKKFSEDTIKTVQPAFELDYKPLSDWRASADYRMMVTKNLLTRFYLEHTNAAHSTQTSPIQTSPIQTSPIQTRLEAANA